MDELSHNRGPDLAGQDFDRWLDWDGNADSSADLETNLPLPANDDSRRRVLYPISPSSSVSEPHRSISKNASSSDWPARTPSTSGHSFGSPPTPSLLEPRLSGDALYLRSSGRSRPSLKRKLSTEEPSLLVTAETLAKPASKKRPHNVIEKRYRANLNDKIAELRDSVPSLRAFKKNQAGEDDNSDNEDLDGLAPTNRLNKASVLTKAVEYIRHLELRNRKLDDENRTLKDRLQTLDKVIALGGSSAQRATAFTTDNTIKHESPGLNTPSADEDVEWSLYPPQGLIPVPESMRKLRNSQPQEHYGHIYDALTDERQTPRKWPTRLMLGSLAGLMILEGFGETDTGTPSKEKGLFGIPRELLDGYRFIRSPRIYLSAFAQYCRAGGILPLVKGFLALTIMAFLIFTYLFHSKPPRRAKTQTPDTDMPRRRPSLTSPIERRRRAWLTNMQVLRLPNHSFFPEWLAVSVEWFAYTIRLLFGQLTYAWVTGRSESDESARIKAWDIAIDAQLNGGDPEISKSRVTLTCFGSGTLPRTPLRIMIKSLHYRVLMWRVGCPGSLSYRLANAVSSYAACRQWRQARRLNEALDAKHEDFLPPYLSALLSQDCDDVFLDSIIQRGYNLMFDRPTFEDTDPAQVLMNVVVDDQAIRSPLDGIAAWWSCQALRKALLYSLESVSDDGSMKHELDLALSTAPPGSAAQTRALAVHSVFYRYGRYDNYTRASEALPGPKDSGICPADLELELPIFIDSSTPVSACAEILNVLRCSTAITVFEDMEASDIDLDTALATLLSHSFCAEGLSLLSFSALYYTLQRLVERKGTLNLEAGAQNTIREFCSWLHSNSPELADVPFAAVTFMDSLSVEEPELAASRRWSNDTGYETMEDEDPTPVDLSKRPKQVDDSSPLSAVDDLYI